MKSAAPLISIGVTTYDRFELLQECLVSILKQSFTDFEVIVSNDNVKRKLTKQQLGITDKRVRIVNQPKNLGEMANMNWLLSYASGHYFTWLADDDAYYPNFVSAIKQATEKYPSAKTIFTSYKDGAKFDVANLSRQNYSSSQLKGSTFLRRYLAKETKAIGCYGVFDRHYLLKLGGIESLGTGLGPYSDNLLLIKTCNQKNIVYIPEALLFFRTHPGSISASSTDIKAYISAQKDFLKKSIILINSTLLKTSASDNLYNLIIWCIKDFREIYKRQKLKNYYQLLIYWIWLLTYIIQIGSLKSRINLIILMFKKTII